MALIITGYPISRASSIASASSLTVPPEPGTTGTPAARMVSRATALSPMPRIWSGVGPTNARSAPPADLGELRVLGQESVTGVHGFGPRDFGGGDDPRHLEVRLRRPGRPDTDGLVGEAHVQRFLVRFRVDRDRRNVQLPAGPDDTERDLAPVRDQKAS